MRRAAAAFVALVVAAVAPRVWADGADAATAFRFEREVQVSARDGGEAGGTWVRIEIPGDVLDATRPGLGDLRLLTPDGAEIPYVLESSVPPSDTIAAPLLDVVSVSDAVTTALVDRGVNPPLADGVELDVPGADFLEPVRILVSDDRRAWSEMARGSIFATAGARMTELRFAPNDRRWWMLRFEAHDRAPLVPRGARIHLARAPVATREIVVPVERAPGVVGKSVYALTLPGKNLDVSRIRVVATDAAYARSAAVLERVVYRGEVSRRALGAGRLTRGADGEAAGDIALGDVAGRALEIEVDDDGSPPLAIQEARLETTPRTIVFFAPAAAPGAPRLVYGSARAASPRYDLGAALAMGRPKVLVPATLGPGVDHGSPPAPSPVRGATLDLAAWRERRAIVLPPGEGGVASIVLMGIAADATRDVRIVDALRAQVPYVVETAPVRTREDVERAVTQKGSRTVLTVSGIADAASVRAVVLNATAPDYFTRSVSVFEAMRDGRGVTGARLLGGDTWERKPGAPAVPMTLAWPTTLSGPELEVRIENGDNAPLTLGAVAVEHAAPRVDFEYARGDRLEVVWGNPAAEAPSYDLALLSDAILGAPAEGATLGPAEAITPPRAHVPGWFWGAVIAAGLIVGAALARGLAKKPA